MVEKKIHHEVDAIQPLRSEELRLAVDQHDFPGLLLKQQITEPQVAMIFSVTLPSDAIHRPSADVVRQNWIDEAPKCIARLVPVDGMFQCGFRTCGRDRRLRPYTRAELRCTPARSIRLTTSCSTLTRSK